MVDCFGYSNGWSSLDTQMDDLLWILKWMTALETQTWEQKHATFLVVERILLLVLMLKLKIVWSSNGVLQIFMPCEKRTISTQKKSKWKKKKARLVLTYGLLCGVHRCWMLELCNGRNQTANCKNVKTKLQNWNRKMCDETEKWDLQKCGEIQHVKICENCLANESEKIGHEKKEKCRMGNWKGKIIMRLEKTKGNIFIENLDWVYKLWKLHHLWNSTHKAKRYHMLGSLSPVVRIPKFCSVPFVLYCMIWKWNFFVGC